MEPSHSWYENVHARGYRLQVFKKALDKISKKNSLVIIFQPPVSPAWKEKTKDIFIGQLENEFSTQMKHLSKESENIVFYDFYSNDIDSLTNLMYYDYQHLNRAGAKVFSELLSNMINQEIVKRSTDNEN
jgi:hypothetical protein